MFAFDMVEGYISEDDRVVTYDRKELHKWEKGEILEYGLEQDLEKGREQIAKAMLLTHENIEKIVEYTKLSKKEIQNLQQEL